MSGLRVLLAVDGSQRAASARALVAGTRWPAGSQIRVVTVLEPVNVLFGSPWAPPVASHMEQLEAEVRQHAQSVVDEAAGAVAQTGCQVHAEVLPGRPASTIVELAGAWPADLIVMGSRGHGSIATMLLGSVTAEVVDQAPCPVLIARGAGLHRVVLGHDGSSYARAAEDLVAEWPIFDDAVVEVVSIAPGGPAWRSGTTPPVAAQVIDPERTAAATLAEHNAIAGDATERLRRAGRQASAVVVQGQPAPSLIGAAENGQADLIVVGSHGRTGLTRVMLGSVARNVMLHAPCSVLIVRHGPAG